MTSNNHIELSLKNFFIYNVSYGQKEGEEEKKILYYYPKGTNIDIQIKDVGLSEAIVKFSSTFSVDVCHALHTEKTKRLFYEPEPNFWIVLTINVGCSEKGKDGMDGTEYHGNEVQDEVYRSVLKQSYLVARLFIGQFTAVLDDEAGDTDLLKRKLDSFFTKYLLNLFLKNCNILDVFQGVHFLPLDKGTFLQAQSFVNLVESAFPQIEHSVLFYQERLVWSGLAPEDIQVVYKYVTTSLIPAFLKAEEGSRSLNSNVYFTDARFVTGPRNVNDISFSSRLPKVYLHCVPEPGFYHFVVYRYSLATICWFIKCDEKIGMNVFRGLDSRSKTGLSGLCEEISSFQSSESESQDSTRYVYFNRMNLAVKVPNQLLNNKEVLNILVDIHNAHSRICETGCMSAETVVKTLKDHWVIGRMSNSREFYITIEKKKLKLNLVEVHEEANKICDKQLKSIFFHI